MKVKTEVYEAAKYRWTQRILFEETVKENPGKLTLEGLMDLGPTIPDEVHEQAIRAAETAVDITYLKPCELAKGTELQ